MVFPSLTCGTNRAVLTCQEGGDGVFSEKLYSSRSWIGEHVLKVSKASCSRGLVSHPFVITEEWFAIVCSVSQSCDWGSDGKVRMKGVNCVRKS